MISFVGRKVASLRGRASVEGLVVQEATELAIGKSCSSKLPIKLLPDDFVLVFASLKDPDLLEYEGLGDPLREALSVVAVAVDALDTAKLGTPPHCERR